MCGLLDAWLHATLQLHLGEKLKTGALNQLLAMALLTFRQRIPHPLIRLGCTAGLGTAHIQE